MIRPIAIRALPGYYLWIRFEDGVEGKISLSHLVGKGVFTLWNDFASFQKVEIGEQGEISWSNEVETCPDSIYLKLSGKTVEEIFPSLPAVELRSPGLPNHWCEL